MLGGNDVIRTGDGNDVAMGGAGNDLVTSAGGNDVLFGDGGQRDHRRPAARTCYIQSIDLCSAATTS